MSSLPRVVIDISVFVSAALFVASVPHRAVGAAFAHTQVRIAEPLILELASVLARPQFNQHITPHDRRAFLTRISRLGKHGNVTTDLHFCRDPKGDHILNLAVDGRGSLILPR